MNGLTQKVSHVIVNLPIPVGFWRSVGHSHQALKSVSLTKWLMLPAVILWTSDWIYLGITLDIHLYCKKLLRKVIGSIQAIPQQMAAQEQWDWLYMNLFVSLLKLQDSVTEGVVKVHKVVCVIDCGTAINPDEQYVTYVGCTSFSYVLLIQDRNRRVFKYVSLHTCFKLISESTIRLPTSVVL
jgi:hypothetical protein